MSRKSRKIIHRNSKFYGYDKITKLLEENNFKIFLLKMEFRRFRNNGASCEMSNFFVRKRRFLLTFVQIWYFMLGLYKFLNETFYKDRKRNFTDS